MPGSKNGCHPCSSRAVGGSPPSSNCTTAWVRWWEGQGQGQGQGGCRGQDPAPPVRPPGCSPEGPQGAAARRSCSRGAATAPTVVGQNASRWKGGSAPPRGWPQREPTACLLPLPACSWGAGPRPAPPCLPPTLHPPPMPPDPTHPPAAGHPPSHHLLLMRTPPAAPRSPAHLERPLLSAGPVVPGRQAVAGQQQPQRGEVAAVGCIVEAGLQLMGGGGAGVGGAGGRCGGGRHWCERRQAVVHPTGQWAGFLNPCLRIISSVLPQPMPTCPCLLSFSNPAAAHHAVGPLPQLGATVHEPEDDRPVLHILLGFRF